MRSTTFVSKMVQLHWNSQCIVHIKVLKYNLSEFCCVTFLKFTIHWMNFVNLFDSWYQIILQQVLILDLVIPTFSKETKSFCYNLRLQFLCVNFYSIVISFV